MTGVTGPVTFGIVALGESLGERVEITDRVIAAHVDSDETARTVRAWGYRGFHRAAEEVLLTDLAVQAAQQALTRASVAAADLDLVVVAIPDLAEYLCWDAAAAVQGRLGATHAEAVLVNHACGSGVMAFDTVAGRLATHPSYQQALIVAANRVCETYQNRMVSTTTVLSDGAAAAVLRRDHDRGRWMATEVVTDGRYADFFRMDVGGTARPFGSSGAPGPSGLVVRNPLERLRQLMDNDARRTLAFVRSFAENMRVAVDRVCERTGVERNDLARVVHLNDNRQAIADIVRALGIAPNRLDGEFALDHGHFGPADQLLSLHRLDLAGQLGSGDVVALTTLGSGMHWAVTLLRW